jgi:Tol biopolymer transport system component
MDPPAVGVACPGLPAEIATRYLAFDSDRAAYNRDIYLVRADGTQLTRITSTPAAEYDPAFSFDAKRLAYVSNETGSDQVYIRDFSDGSIRQLTNQAGGADQPAWSHDGKRLAFHSGISVYMIDADGMNQQLVSQGVNDYNPDEYPSFSADGTQLVFDRGNQIEAIRIDGSNRRLIVQAAADPENSPAVSPDGYNVAFAMGCMIPRIAVVPFAGSPATACMVTFVSVAENGAAHRPAWGPSNYLAFEQANATPSGASASGAAGQAAAFGGTRIVISAGPGANPCDVVSGPYRNLNPTWATTDFVPPAPASP